MHQYRSSVRYPLFIPLVMLLLLLVNGYHIAIAISGGHVSAHSVMLGLNVLITVLAITFLVLVYRQRGLLTSPVELTETHIHAVVIGKKNAFRLQGKYQAVPWQEISAVEDFDKVSSHGRQLGEHDGMELQLSQGSILVWSNISDYEKFKSTVLAKVRPQEAAA
jgi:hypothetical protein